MAKIPPILHSEINGAFPDNVCLVGVTLPNGYAQISPRGSVQVFDDETIAYWARGGGKTAESVSDGSKVTIYFRNRALGGHGGNGLLRAGGIARFYGTAELHKDGDTREQVYANMHQAEQNNDAEKKGYAVLVRLERVEDLLGNPLPEDLKIPE